MKLWSEDHGVVCPDDDFLIPDYGTMSPKQAMKWLCFYTGRVCGGDDMSDLIHYAAEACGVDPWGGDFEP